MATGEPYVQTDAERALVGQWGLFRTSWPSSLDIGQIVRFTRQRVYTARKHNASPRERSSLLAVVPTKEAAEAVAEQYQQISRSGPREVDEAQAALSAAKARRLEAAGKALAVGTTPPEAPEI